MPVIFQAKLLHQGRRRIPVAQAARALKIDSWRERKPEIIVEEL